MTPSWDDEQAVYDSASDTHCASCQTVRPVEITPLFPQQWQYDSMTAPGSSGDLETDRPVWTCPECLEATLTG